MKSFTSTMLSCDSAVKKNVSITIDKIFFAKLCGLRGQKTHFSGKLQTIQDPMLSCLDLNRGMRFKRLTYLSSNILVFQDLGLDPYYTFWWFKIIQILVGRKFKVGNTNSLLSTFSWTGTHFDNFQVTMVTIQVTVSICQTHCSASKSINVYLTDNNVSD